MRMMDLIMVVNKSRFQGVDLLFWALLHISAKDGVGECGASDDGAEGG